MAATVEELHALEAEYQSLTGGARGYLYATQPASVTYYVFVDGARVSGLDKAVEYMKGLLAMARSQIEGN